MTIVNKERFISLMQNYPNGGIVFAELDASYNLGEVMVTDGNFGATNIVPHEGEVFDWDWNINESFHDDEFAIFDKEDILQMIQTLTKGLSCNLTWDGPVSV